jgi:uncharacterized protein GlcG (DUF336 family)
VSQYCYDYYHIDVPSDYSEDPEERAETAINEARERARLYCIPCTWTIIDDDGETVLVRRKRINTKERAK